MTETSGIQKCNVEPTAKNHCGNCANTACDWYAERETLSRINEHGDNHFSMRLATEMTGCRCHISPPGLCPQGTVIHVGSDEEQMYLIREGELLEIADHFKRGNNPIIAKRMGAIISTISDRPHTSAPAPARDMVPKEWTCPYAILCRNCKSSELADAAAKAAREQDQKRWQKLEDYIDANSPWVQGTDDRVTDARKLIAEVRSLRSLREGR